MLRYVPEPEVEEIILIEWLSLDELEVSQSCVRTPAAELLEPAAIKQALLIYYA